MDPRVSSLETLRLGAVVMRTKLFLALPLLSVSAYAQQPGDTTRPPRDPFRFEYVGPPSAGRIAAIAGIPGDPSTYYAGAASGGVWKTTDSARTFTPVFDDQPVQAIGALAVAPSDPRSWGPATAKAGPSVTATCWGT